MQSQSSNCDQLLSRISLLLAEPRPPYPKPAKSTTPADTMARWKHPSARSTEKKAAPSPPAGLMTEKKTFLEDLVADTNTFSMTSVADKKKNAPTPEALEFTSILGVAFAHMLAFNKGKNKAAELFSPAVYGYPTSWSTSDIAVQPPGANCTYLACPDAKLCADCNKRPFHEDTLLVATSAAVSDDGKPDGVRMDGLGIYVGEKSENNIKARLPGAFHGEVMTLERAELLAAAKTLLHIFWVAQVAGPRISDKAVVVIKMDLGYAVTAMTDWLDKWKKAGWNKDGSVSAVNVELIKAVGTAIRMVERQMKCKVMFWHVKREENADAVRLAQEGSKEELRDWSDPMADGPLLRRDKLTVETREQVPGLSKAE